MSKCSKLYLRCVLFSIEPFEFVSNFVFWSFDIVSNFVFRISNFPSKIRNPKCAIDCPHSCIVILASTATAPLPSGHTNSGLISASMISGKSMAI
jgi:hypothetical protein